MTTPPSDPAANTTADELDPALIELHAYLTNDDQWRELLATPLHNVHTRTWPDGSVDTVAISATTVVIERLNRLDKCVWCPEGTTAERLAALRELPPPFAPDAPRAPLQQRPQRERERS